MAVCRECSLFFSVPSDAGDYEEGKGDCVTEVTDEKGKYWLSKPVYQDMKSCPNFKSS